MVTWEALVGRIVSSDIQVDSVALRPKKGKKNGGNTHNNKYH